MKTSNDCFKQGLQRRTAVDKADPRTAEATRGQEESDDLYNDESAFNWMGDDQDGDRATDFPSGTPEELSSSNTVTVRTLTLDEESTYIVEESTGVDPYNTGRFDAAKS
jgi:hypothetical protein